MRRWNKIIGLVMLLMLFNSLVAQAADPTLSEVAGLLKENYVDPVDSNVLQAPTIGEMLKRLADPYAKYYTKAEFQQEMDALNGQFTGIGVYFHPGAQGAQVFGLVAGSPAEKAGIKENDLIIEADGKSLAGLDTDGVSAIIRGPVNSSLSLKLKRGSEVLTFLVVRQQIQLPSVDSTALNKDTGLIVLNEFGSHSAEEMGAAIRSLKSQNIERWILDMRDNPGGFLDIALYIAGFFIGNGDTVIVKERSKKEIYPGELSKEYVDGPLIVLINENSASAAEIVAAALKDQERALILGHNSYGKGTVQQMFELSNGDQIKFTIARFYSPREHAINGIGIKPDIEVSDDNALKAAELLMYDVPASYKGKSVVIGTDRFIIDVDPQKARTGEYWAAWNDIIKGIGGCELSLANPDGSTDPLSLEEISARWPLYYPGYEYKGELALQDRSSLKLDFLEDVKPSYLNSTNINLISSATGERIPLQFSSSNGRQVVAQTRKALTRGEYWLVVDPTYLRFNDGHKLDKGLLASFKVD